jgi:hypothetical protein
MCLNKLIESKYKFRVPLCKICMYRYGLFRVRKNDKWFLLCSDKCIARLYKHKNVFKV